VKTDEAIDHCSKRGVVCQVTRSQENELSRKFVRLSTIVLYPALLIVYSMIVFPPIRAKKSLSCAGSDWDIATGTN
jgi:hypothetical protein